MKSTIRIAAINAETKPQQTSANLDLIANWCRKAAGEGVELALFPELSVTGFIPNHPTGDHASWLRQALLAARESAQPLTGDAVTQLTAIAQSTGVRIAAGLLEDAGNRLYNTTVLVGSGGIEGDWRKMHIPMFEMPFYIGGPAPQVADTPLGRIGVNICFDAMMPESTRLLAAQNVEIVLFPFAADPPPCTAAAWAAWAAPAVKARCVENGVFGVACNYKGYVTCAGVEQTFPGGSLFIGPRGETISEQLDGSSIHIATIESRTLLEARADPDYLYRFRRPELYADLLK